MHPRILAYGVGGAAIVMAINILAGIIFLTLFIAYGVVVTARSWYGKRGDGARLRLKEASVDEFQVNTAMKAFGVPRDVAIQTLPKHDLRSNLFGKHPMGNLKPIFDWLRENDPEKYSTIDPKDIAHFAR